MIVQLQQNVRKTDFAWQKPVSEQCKQKVENCSCGHASCIFTGAQKHDIIDICCEEQYEFKSIDGMHLLYCFALNQFDLKQTLLKQMEGCKETLNKLCPCGLYNCIRKEGAGRTACCAEHYAFSCCEKPPPPETPTALQLKQNETCTVAAKADCDCGWAKCIRDEGYGATACCATNYKFTCCVTPPTTTTTV
uniref:Uncharacterized protein n=1 Tax=Globodera pallida TaxID=36090 RepID=A0A183CAG5_GLOPA